MAAGAERIVVVRAIRDAEDPGAAARRLREALEAGVGAAALMASRERRRAERTKRKARSVERRGQIAARYEERNRAAREALEPLPEGERPAGRHGRGRDLRPDRAVGRDRLPAGAEVTLATVSGPRFSG